MSSNLPIHEHLEQIQTLIQENSVIIVAGETGSGKSTQLPQICYRMGLAENGHIAHTQPRRLAARTVATRVAEEMKTELGALVGYRMRFQEKVSAQTAIHLMTDGLLLAELSHDHVLSKYSVVIIDEAHERSLNIDFLMGYLKRILEKRPDLKVIITSATIDHQRFSEHFDNAPIVEIEGRTFPVELQYEPLVDDEGNVTEQREGILRAVKSLSKRGHGDILVFLSTERDIHDTADFLKRSDLFNTDILPLFSRLPIQQQQAIFAKSSKRKVVLSTNVAETSITVPGILFVIDTGTARIKRYNYRSKVERLPIEAISQASANQRKGRCGRVAPGVCIRLYSQEDFESRPAFTEPEIRRSNLASVILMMKQLRLGDLEHFPFIEPPENTFIKDGYRLLHELSALDDRHHLTKLGRQIAKLPVDPRLARMILSGKDMGELDAVIRIVAFLSVGDPRMRPVGFQKKADEAHVKYRHKTSDFLSILKLHQIVLNETKDLSNKQRKQYYERNYLSFMRFKEWRDIDRQLRETCDRAFKWKVPVKSINVEKIDKLETRVHQSILPGVLSHLGLQDEQGVYFGARGVKFNLFPGSPVSKKPPKWVMAYEIVETAKVYARTVAKLDPTWVEKAAEHLLKREYFEPFWRDTGFVGGYEKLTLYGLEVIPKRPINYGPVDPKISREIFIRHALVMGETAEDLSFLKPNAELLEALEAFEHQQRASGLIVSEQKRYEFFAGLVPDGIYTMIDFKQWFKTADADSFLYTREFLLNESGLTDDNYPENYAMGDITLKLTYHFEPGTEDDGVSLNIPLPLLNQVDADVCSWLIRPLLTEKVEALLRTLPKNLRRMCAPVSHYAGVLVERINLSCARPGIAAEAAMPSLREGGTDCSYSSSSRGPNSSSSRGLTRGSSQLQSDWTPRSSRGVTSVLAEELTTLTGATFKPTDFNESAIDTHLRMNYKLLDESGELIKQSRDLADLLDDFQHTAEQATCDMHDDLEQDGLTEWNFGDLPQKIDVEEGGVSYVAYPALIDAGDSVQIRAKSNQGEAQVSMRDGMLRLFRLACAKEERYLRKQLPHIQKLVMLTKPLDLDVMDEFVSTVFARVFEVKKLVYRQADFEARLAHRGELQVLGAELLKLLVDILTAYQDVRLQIKRMRLSRLSPDAFADIESQLDCLIYEGFVEHTPEAWLKRYPVYFKALLTRLDKIQSNALKDLELQAQIDEFWDVYLQDESASLNDESHYWIEEFRVSLFAQQLKTAGPISAKRLRNLI